MNPVVADTSAFSSLCKTSYDSAVFETIPFTVTDVCMTEMKESSPAMPQREQQARTRFLEIFRSSNAEIAYQTTGVEWDPYVDHQGKESIRWLIENKPADLKLVVLYDFAAESDITALRDSLQRSQGTIDVRRPGRPLELLYERDRLTRDEFIDGVEQMIDGEGWEVAPLIEHTDLELSELSV
ncbi:MAG: hypothetical protein ABEJ31_01445 [Haloarculaceae archaeon]